MAFTGALDLRPRVSRIQSETSRQAGPSVATFQNAPQIFEAQQASVCRLVYLQGSGRR